MKTSYKWLYAVFILIGILFVIVMVYVYVNYNPMENPIFPQCTFYKITGYQCPGCGGQRAFHLLLHGRLWESFKMNPLLWVATIYAIVLALLKIPYLKDRFGWLQQKMSGISACVAWLIGIFAFWILRNLW